MLMHAVRQKAWQSPVQPSRSSRCGQSVGTSTKLPRCPHWMLWKSWLTRSSEQPKPEVTAMSELMTTPAKSRTSISHGQFSKRT